jgi:hypothetical protein
MVCPSTTCAHDRNDRSNGTAVALVSHDMLRISEVIQGAHEARTFRLEGNVTGPWVTELRRVCLEALESNGHRCSLVLDLTGLAFLDVDGVALFRDLTVHRVTFINPSPFIAEQLRGVVDVQR